MSASAAEPCNLTPTQLMQKVYELVQIFQTFSLLLREIRSLCVRSFFRWLFSILFYFTPQLNPFRLVDAYNAAAELIRAKQESEKEAENSGQRVGAVETNVVPPEGPEEESRSPSKPPPQLPNIYGYA
ncbi:hypothetical protein SEPCBS57363_000673 [Sporothrix epigloea]|uniref:Uncharacterized protein n=1 Tax=Sporothrix epigloea TaxID=1892477 RepID=A0ABP0D601_9PEZI